MKRRALQAYSLTRFSLSGVGAAVLAVMFIVPVGAAQSKVINLSAPSKPVTMQDVIRLTQAGTSDDIIIEQIKSHKERFLLSTDQILKLKAAKVSDRVIATMINPDYRLTLSTAGTKSFVSEAAPPPANVPIKQPESSGAGGSVVPDSMPSQLGIYVKVKGTWVTLSPEIVTFKSGGIAKSVASGGIVKGDVNGFVDGSSSRVRVKNPLELVVVVPEGIDIKAYQLVRLNDHEDYREFRTVAGGVFHVSGGATRDVIPFNSVQVAPRVYHITTSTALGEYGILPPGAFTSMNAASSGTIYSFGLIESCGFTVPSCE